MWGNIALHPTRNFWGTGPGGVLGVRGQLITLGRELRLKGGQLGAKPRKDTFVETARGPVRSETCQS